MIEKNVKLLALSESRWTGCGITRIRSTTTVHSGSSSNHVCSGAIALSSHACSSLEAASSVFHPISECIICISLKIHLSYASVIAIYAPTNPVSYGAEASVQSDNIYDLLQDTLSSFPPRDMVILLGEYNARVGSNFVSHSSVIGLHGLGECNANGTRLLDFCMSNQLLFTNLGLTISCNKTKTMAVLPSDLYPKSV